MKKNVLVLAAMAGFATAEAQPPQKGEKPVECFGVNSCKGSGKCGISKEQIQAANKQFKNKFDKTKDAHDCAGHNACGGKGGHFAWVEEKNAAECHSKGGFTFKKGADGQLTIDQGSAQSDKKKG